MRISVRGVVWAAYDLVTAVFAVLALISLVVAGVTTGDWVVLLVAVIPAGIVICYGTAAGIWLRQRRGARR